MCQSELTEFFAELTGFAVKLSEFSSPKQYSRNSILLPFPTCLHHCEETEVYRPSPKLVMLTMENALFNLWDGFPVSLAWVIFRFLLDSGPASSSQKGADSHLAREPVCQAHVGPRLVVDFQARKKEHKPKFLSPDIFQWGGGLSREGVGAKKFGIPLETTEIKLFWRDIPGFCRDIPGAPEKFEKKKICVRFSSPRFVL